MTELNEITSYKVYKKDKSRIDLTKWQIAKDKKLDQKLNEQDLMTALLDFYYDNQLTKKQ
jgi:hypothetical protein